MERSALLRASLMAIFLSAMDKNSPTNMIEPAIANEAGCQKTRDVLS